MASAAVLLWCIAARAQSPYLIPRYNHTSTLLPDGNLLFCGGQNGIAIPGNVMSFCQLTNSHRQALMDVTPITLGGTPLAITSHTATLLPTGEVLFAGGMSTTPVNTAEVYNPIGNCWRAAGNAMQATLGAGRFNHTATLLQNGKVLLCGGQNLTGMYNTCELYTPTAADPTCASPAGSFSASPPSMSVPRALHTATLLTNGQVFVAGGYATTGSIGNFLLTTERYDPGSNLFTSATNLIQERAMHTATMLGNGNVLIVGGHNAKDQQANRGHLASAELFDPVGNTVSPASPLLVRLEQQTALLDNTGSVAIFGGLGNITTTYQTSPPTINSMTIPLTFSGTLPIANITPANDAASSVVLGWPTFALSAPVTGVVQNGVVWISSPVIQQPAVKVSMIYGQGQGANADLQGSVASCDPTGVTCGLFNRQDLQLHGLAGATVYFQPIQSASITGSVVVGTVTFSGGPFTQSNGAINLTGGTIQETLTAPLAGFDGSLVGAMVSSMTFTLKTGSISTTTANVTLNSAVGSILYCPPTCPTFASDGGTGAQLPTGTQILWQIPAGPPVPGVVTFTTTTPEGSPVQLDSKSMTATASILYTASQTTFNAPPNKPSFSIDIATFVINNMIFGDDEIFNPQGNSWSFNPRRGLPGRFNHSAVLTPGDDQTYWGGQSCDQSGAHFNHDCPTPLVPVPAGSNGGAYIAQLSNWTSVASMPVPVSHHTTTPLSNGQLLITGGSNGPNVIASAFLFDPKAKSFTQTGSMYDVRDLHTSTLLPNGRVLVAGGFSTNAVATGTINGAELYFPDTAIWLRTTPMSTVRQNHAAVLLADGNVMVMGGSANGAYLASAEIYYSTAGVWRTIPPMNVQRANHSATLLQDGRVLVAGGVNATGVQASAEIYDPNKGFWDPADITCMDNGAVGPVGGIYCNLPSKIRIHSHQATQLPDGQVLVSGGNDGTGETDTSLLFQPGTRLWSDTRDTANPLTLGVARPLNVKRFNHTATLLPNGIVLVAGGAQALGNSVNAVETFSIYATSWQVAGSMSVARAYHTTTLAKNSYLFAIGGSNGGSPIAGVDSIYFTGFPDAVTVGAPPSARLSTITAVDLGIANRGNPLTVFGQNFLGATEGNGGGPAAANTSQFEPRIVMQGQGSSGGSGSQGGSSFALDLSTRLYSYATNQWSNVNSSITVQLPSLGPGQPATLAQGGLVLPYGWYHLRVGSNAQFSDAVALQAGPPLPTAPVTQASGTVVGANTIYWYWNMPASGNFDGFDVYAASTNVLITTVAVTANPQLFIQTGLSPNATGQIKIAPYTLSGDSQAIVSPVVFTVPAAPIAIPISTVTSTSVLLTWNTNGNAVGTIYEVEMSSALPTSGAFQAGDVSISTPVPAVLAVTTNFYLINNLTQNTTYEFQIHAINGSGFVSAWSNVVSTTTHLGVQGLKGVRNGPTSIQWSWSDPGVGPGGYFNVFNATSGAIITSTQNPIFIETGLSTNSAYAIQIAAVTGGGQGPLSASVTTFTDAAVPGPVSPGLTSISTGGFVASWTANGNPLGTQYQAVVSQIAGAQSSTTTTTGFAIAVGGLTPPGAVWDVRVRAVNGDGFPTDATNPLNILVIGSTATLVNPPINLVASNATPTSITLGWSTNNNSSSATYELTFSTDNFGTSLHYAVPFAAHFNLSSFLVNGLLTSTTYSFRVQAENLSGQVTAFSNIIVAGTINGGAPPGSLGVMVISTQATVLNGNLGNGRTVLITIPPNTFPGNTFLAVSSFNVAGILCANGANVAVSIVTTPPMQPLKPVYMTLSYTLAELGAIPANQAALERVDSSGTCVPLNTTLDTFNNLLTAELNHFSLFQLAQVQPTSTTDSAVIFPNPFYPSQGNGYVTFSQLPAQARVRIFTMRGELVFDANTNGSGLLTWPGTNKAGRSVASGVYLAVVDTGSANKHIYKLAVVR